MLCNAVAGITLYVFIILILTQNTQLRYISYTKCKAQLRNISYYKM